MKEPVPAAGRYAARASTERVGRVPPVSVPADPDVIARLAQLEALASQQSETLAELMRVVEDIRAAMPGRRPTSRSIPKIELIPMTDEEMQIGGQYMFRVANPRKPFFARAMILGTTEDPESPGTVLYRFVRADTSRKFQPRPASEFYKLPKDWKDPAEDAEEEAEEESAPPKPTARPRG